VQLVDDIPFEPFDLPVDVIATPTGVIRVSMHDSKPREILWECITADMMRQIPLLAEIIRVAARAGSANT